MRRLGSRTRATRPLTLQILCLLAWIFVQDLKPIFAGDPPGEWLNKEKFLGIRCGVDEQCLIEAKKMGLNTVLANDNFILEPASTDYPQKLETLQRVSALAKKLDLHFFMGWHAMGPQVRNIARTAEEKGVLCVSDPAFWDKAFAEPMERVVAALSGPEYRLDGFLPDIENYARKPIDWSPMCGGSKARSLQAGTDRARATRERLQALKPGLHFGIYPLRLNEGRKVLWAWIRGISQPEQPVLLLMEYTYSGYQPELDLAGKKAAYGSKAGNPVLLIPGFNFLKIPKPQAWTMHLYAFAEEAGGYWLYPGDHLIRKAPIGPYSADSAYASIREANTEITALIEDPEHDSPLDYRLQPHHEFDPSRVQELTAMAAAASPVEAQLSSPSRMFIRTGGDADLLIKAGPGQPIDLTISGKGYFSVYDGAGQLRALEDFDPQGRSFRLPVESEGAFSVMIKITGGQFGAEIGVANRFWAIRGVSRGTSQGRTARFLNRIGPGPFYFYVPEGTPFFRMYISDATGGCFAVVKDSRGREIVRQSAGYLNGDKEHARQDVEIQVPAGEDGKIWSVHGHPISGLPYMVMYGIPDLFNPDPNRLLTLGDTALAARRQQVDNDRTIAGPTATRLWIEAEDLYGGPWRLSQAFPGTSGEGAMFARGFRSALPLYDQFLVPHSGQWRIWVRSLAAEGSKKRAVQVQIEDTALQWTHREKAPSPVYTWESAGIIQLSSGRKILKLLATTGSRPMIDVIALSDDLQWIPEGNRRP